MDIKIYTDEKYIPISDLSSMGERFISETMEYRRNFIEIIPVSDMEFTNIVETPKLIKKRYEKNVEIKGLLNINAVDNDYILELALMIVRGTSLDIITDDQKNFIFTKYIDNNKDLTIITSWLIENIESIITAPREEIEYDIPELNAKDIKFITKYYRINQRYSISKYNILNGTSYETGRRALYKMTKLGLYEKNKLGNKFLFKPTKKLGKIMKGISYGN